MTIETAPPVFVYGEVLWDVLPEKKVLGGAPANFAYRLQSLGTPVILVSKVGKDSLGTEIEQILGSKGLNTSFIQESSHLPTGTVAVFLDSNGSPTYDIKTNVAYDSIELTAQLIEQISCCRVICFGTLIQRSNPSQETLYSLIDRAPGITCLVDLNLRPHCYTSETVIASISRADILKLNEDEMKVVAGILDCESTVREFIDHLSHNYKLSCCLITRGSEGVIGWSREDGFVDVPGQKVEVVDTIGSGDAFTAAFVHHYLKGASLLTCCQKGNQLGAMVASVEGGMGEVDYSQLG